MIKISCSDTGTTVLLSDITPFQGTAKKRTKADIDQLAQSLCADGLLQPLSVWEDPTDNKIYMLDGHGRMEALIHLALEDVSILQQPMPVVCSRAATHEDAVKACLQMMSTYGRIHKPGVVKLAAGVTDYVAPVMPKVKIPSTVAVTPAPVEHDSMLIRLRVRKDKVAELVVLLKQVDGVDVL